MLPIIDTHQHLWDINQFDLPWLAEAEALAKNHLTSDYLEATTGLNVVKAIYMEVDVRPDQHADEAEALIEMCRRDDNPTCGAVIGGRPADEGFGEYVRRFADSPYIKGVRQVLHVPDTAKGMCRTEAFIDGVRLLGKMGLCFDLCMRPAELGDALALVDACPDTNFVVDHCGNADPKIVGGSAEPEPDNPFDHTDEQWRRDMGQLSQRDHVICKISGIVARVLQPWDAQTLAPTVNYCIEAFGSERVVFGGDWPVCNLGADYRGWATALREIIAPRSEADQRKLLHDNAARFYQV